MNRVNCIESCPKCKNMIQFNRLKNGENIYWLDCKYMKDIVIDELSKCNGMFEPKEANS